MAQPDLPLPESGVIVTHFSTVADWPRATRFYTEGLGGTAVLDGQTTHPERMGP